MSDDAGDKFEQMYRNRDKNPAAWLQLGLIFQEYEDLSGAAYCYEKSATEGNVTAAMVNLAEIHMLTARRREGNAAMEREAMVWYSRAVRYGSIVARFELAKRWFRKNIRLDEAAVYLEHCWKYCHFDLRQDSCPRIKSTKIGILQLLETFARRGIGPGNAPNEARALFFAALRRACEAEIIAGGVKEEGVVVTTPGIQ